MRHGTKNYNVFRKRELTDKEQQEVNSLLIRFRFYLETYRNNKFNKDARNKYFEIKETLHKKYKVEIVFKNKKHKENNYVRSRNKASFRKKH